MKPLLFLFAFIISILVFTSCSPKFDEAISPSSINQKNMIFRFEGKTYVGLLPILDRGQSADILIVGGSSVINIDGVDECFYHSTISASTYGWARLNLATLPNKELCTYTLTSTVNGFDAPALGTIMVRKFYNPNIQPLRIEIGSSSLRGVHALETINGDDRDILINPRGSRGTIVISGCDRSLTLPFSAHKYISAGTLSDTFDDYMCAVSITVINDDYMLESSTVLVSQIQEGGSFLDAPVVKGKSKDMCFKFSDPYAVMALVNGKNSSMNNPLVCVTRSNTYEVLGITSKLRVFYGRYDGSEWKVLR